MNDKQLEKRSKAKAAVAYAKGQITREEHLDVLRGQLTVSGGYLRGPDWCGKSKFLKIIRKLGSEK